MTISPQLLKGGIVLLDPGSGAVQRIITLQYNPTTLTRSLQAQGHEGQGGDRAEALRLTGPPIETIRLEAEIDATDQLEHPDQNQVVTEYGIQPQLAALEMMIYPTTSQLNDNFSRAAAGTMEIVASEAALTVFVWSKSRIAPVRIVEFSIEEQFFDPNLNPMRAKVGLGMRVLNVNDLGFRHRGGNLFMVYQQQKERLAAMGPAGEFRTLGIGGIPS